jgi:NAD(P)-dependent dehydrogenase (short-subunit alcohol dehydrogenase family)
MTKLIVVCGATGGLGGSVARRMLSEGWRVRGITRNKDSAGAKALVEAGAELASANYDDVASLEAAFEGADAIFGVTNFWEYLLELGAMAAAKKETQQLVKIATAANKISSLEHLVLHTLPSGEKLGGKYVPHMDVSCLLFEILDSRYTNHLQQSKDQAADDIKAQFPDLSKKTTFLWVGFFTSNIWSYPMMKPIEIVS